MNEQIIQLALANPEKSPRQLAWQSTDQEGYFVSESSVFRLLKRFDLIESPAFEVVTAVDRFQAPTKQVNEWWQTDFTYFKIQNWGWYYLSTVLDDYSRYILARKLCSTTLAPRSPGAAAARQRRGSVRACPCSGEQVQVWARRTSRTRWSWRWRRPRSVRCGSSSNRACCRTLSFALRLPAGRAVTGHATCHKS